MKIDLHLHSEYSWDSKVKILDYIKQAENQNFGAISISDHNNTESHSYLDMYQKKTDVLLIPGQEVSTTDGHLLVYGWQETLPEKLSMLETVQIAQKHNGVCIAAHPYDPFRSGSFSRIFESNIDGFELLNASAWFGFPNWLAKRAHKTHQTLIGLGNSDSHRLSEFGSAFSLVDNAKRPSENFSREEILNFLNTANPLGKRIGMIRKVSRLIRRL